VGESLTHNLQEAEQAGYAHAQVAAGPAVPNVPAQDVQSTAITGATDTSAMDVDGEATAQGTAGEGHGGVKRKAGEDAEPTAKKMRMGVFLTLFYVSATDTTPCRPCRHSLEEVSPADIPLVLHRLTGDCRDRENCTVFVSDLPESATEDDLKALFKDVRSYIHFFGEGADREHVWLLVWRRPRG
jgi:hypothetical protein